jgi:hypothetical protein
LLIACTIGVLGTFESMRLFSPRFKWDFYVYFTNLSNYFCLIILFIELGHTLLKKKNDYINIFPKLKFVGVIAILLTFVVFNFILGPGRSLKENLKFESLSFHFIMPILFIGDWFLFYERKKMDYKYPLYGLIFPGAYLLFIIIHAAILDFDTTIISLNGYSPLIYPYFFIDFEQNGITGVLKYCLIIVLGLIVVGYGFYFIDHIDFKKKKSN